MAPISFFVKIMPLFLKNLLKTLIFVPPAQKLRLQKRAPFNQKLEPKIVPTLIIVPPKRMHISGHRTPPNKGVPPAKKNNYT